MKNHRPLGIGISNLCQEIILPYNKMQRNSFYGVNPSLYVNKVLKYRVLHFYPFTITEHYSSDDTTTTFGDNLYDEIIVAQFNQSKKWVEYGKSQKRVQKHKKKMEWIAEEFPADLL